MWRTRLRTALLAAAALLMTTAVAGQASPGTSPGIATERVVTYEVRTRGDVRADPAVFARVAQQTFNDRRGWSLGGSVRYRQVDSGGDFTLWLASPSEVADFAPVCDPQYSCTAGRDVVINDERWRRGTSSWPEVREYRSYVLNHELGHWIGLDHRECTGQGEYAPVMQQQSISLDGCDSNTWPLDGERTQAARRLGVDLRTTRPELYGVLQDGRTGTELHVLDGGDRYRSFSVHAATALGGTAAGEWAFAVGDRDRDGFDDVFAIKRDGASGGAEVHVLDGASRWSSFQLHAATPLGPAPAAGWSFDVADTDGDGHLDVVAVKHSGASGSTEVHVLDGASRYRRWLSHAATPLHPVEPSAFALRTGDHDRDGWPDLYALARRGGSGSTEVHVLDGESGFQRWLEHTATPLQAADPQEWALHVEDVQGDGYETVVAVDRAGASGRTEVHVLDDAQYDRFVLHAATGLHPTRDQPWQFAAD